MATLSRNVAPDSASDAAFRAWCQFIHDMFSTGGWVQTADAGQINLTTVLKPSSTSQKVGYEVWRMADANQASYPLYIKIAYGSGASLTTGVGIWFAIGGATDGAGNIVDDAGRASVPYLDQYSQSSPAINVSSNNASTRICFGSADTDRIVFMMFEALPRIQYTTASGWIVNTADDSGVNSNYPLLFSLERARDSSGAVDPTGFVVIWSTTNSNVNRVYFGEATQGWVPLSVGSDAPVTQLDDFTQRSINQDPFYPPPYTTPPTSTATDGTCGPIIPFRHNCIAAPHGLNVVASRYAQFAYTHTHTPPVNLDTEDYVSGTIVSTSPYGAAHNYRSVAGLRLAWGSNRDTNGYLHIRYE